MLGCRVCVFSTVLNEISFLQNCAHDLLWFIKFPGLDSTFVFK